MVHVIDVLMWLFTLEFWLFEGLRLIWVITINFVYCPRLWKSARQYHYTNSPCILLHVQNCQHYIINMGNH